MITFAIPFYQNPELLRVAIQSVFDQTRSDWRLIISEDCGPDQDEARHVVDSFGKDPRVQFVQNEQNLGLGGNWNRCLDLVQTSYVTLLHSDDQLLPNYTEVMLDAFQRWPEAIALFCQAQVIDAKGVAKFSMPDFIKRFLIVSSKKEFVLAGEVGLRALMRGNFIMCPTLCYQMSQLGSAKFKASLRYVLDLEMTTRFLLDGKQLVGLPQIAYAYRRHAVSTSATGMADMSMFLEEVQLYDQLATQASQLGWHQAASVARRKRIIQLQVGFYGLKDLARFQVHNGLKKLSYLKSLMLDSRDK